MGFQEYQNIVRGIMPEPIPCANNQPISPMDYIAPENRLFGPILFFATMLLMLAAGIFAQYKYPQLVDYKWYFMGTALALCIYDIIFQ